MMDFRCPNKLHGRKVEPDLIEVSCDSRWCGKRAGVVILHRFNAETGELVETLQFKAPPTQTQNEKGNPC